MAPVPAVATQRLDKCLLQGQFWAGMQSKLLSLMVALVVASCFTLPQPGASAEATTAAAGGGPEPLYLLTYDHGGLVLWGHEHFAERLRDAVSWLEKYPGFKIGLDNEAHTYDVLAEQNPQLLEQIRDSLKRYAGRFAIGTCTYGQPLSTFIGEESNVRQLVEAIRADQRHFNYTPVVYLMSEHAMHSQIPQLLAGCGFKAAIMRTHFMMYGYNPTFDAPIGWWVGLDGSRVPTIPTYPGEGAAFGKTTVDNWILTRWPGKDTPKSLADFRKDFAHIHPLLASRADDSGLRKEALVQDCEGKPEYRWLLLDELLRAFPKPVAEFKTEPNDFTLRMPWGYCGNEIWNSSRQAEVQVLTAERLAALEQLAGGGTNREPELEKAWKNLLVAQHHDVQICGLLADARRFLKASLASSASVQNDTMRSFASRMKGEGVAQVTAFNPSSWRRREWLQTELAFPEKGQAKQILVKQKQTVSRAVLLSAERYSDGSLMLAKLGFPIEMEGLSLASFSLVGDQSEAVRAPGSEARVRIETNAENPSIVTPFYKAQLHADGGLALLEDRRTGLSLLKPGRRSAFFTGTVDGEKLESHGQWLLPRTAEDAPVSTAREDGRIGAIPYTFELTFYCDTPRVDARMKFHFAGQKLGRVSTNPRDGSSGFVHEEKLRFKLFPSSSGSAVGVRDLPFAVAETTNRYVEGNYWTALTDNQAGMAVFNRGTMGSDREEDGGLSVPLAFAMYYIWGTRMLDGDFEYEFALYPFTGDWRLADLHRRALEYNFPMINVSSSPGTGKLGDEVRLVEAGSDHVLLSALYPKGVRVLARLYEYQGRSGEVPITFLAGPGRLQMVDLLGDHAHPKPSAVTFKPWQIQTFEFVGQRRQ